jgi:hypothetical protein
VKVYVVHYCVERDAGTTNKGFLSIVDKAFSSRKAADTWASAYSHQRQYCPLWVTEMEVE